MRATERTQNPRSCGGAPHQRLRVIHVINPIGLRGGETRVRHTR